MQCKKQTEGSQFPGTMGEEYVKEGLLCHGWLCRMGVTNPMVCVSITQCKCDARSVSVALALTSSPDAERYAIFGRTVVLQSEFANYEGEWRTPRLSQLSQRITYSVKRLQVRID